MAIFTSIATAIAGALFGGSALAASLIGSALAFGTQLVIGKLSQQKQQKRKYTAVQGEIQFGGDVPVGTLYGTGKLKGQRAFYAKWGKGNKFNAEVFILANGRCDGLETYIYMYGEKYNLVTKPTIGNEAARYGVEGFIDDDGDLALELRFYDGRPGQGVDQRLVDVTADLGNKWKATSRLTGMSYVVVERYYNLDMFADAGRGKPDIDFVLRGLREYDPRKDSTVAGGSGPQRLNNPSTWVHTKNPAVHRLNYQLGLRAFVSGRTLIGEGKSLGQIDLATYFVAMNVCDTLRSNGKKTYECSLFVNGDDDHTEVLKQFDDAMAGYGLNRRGLSGVIPGAPQIPVKELTEADIPIDRAKDIQFRKSAFERYNHLSGQFTSIESMWNPESLKPVYVNADVAADGRNRQTSIDFLQVSDPDIAQYLLNIRYRQNRMGGTATVPVSRRFGLAVQEGEWITWRGKTWMISEWRADERLRITLVLSETSAAIYDDEDIEPGPIVIPPTPPINPSLLSTVQDFNVQAGMITGAAGYDVPCLQFTWTPPDDPTITAVRIVYKVDGGAQEFQEQCLDPESGSYITTKNVASDQFYVARATITTVPDRFKTFTPWVTTASPTGFLSVQAGFDQLKPEITERLKELQSEITDFLTPTVEQLLTAFSLEGAVGQVQREQLLAEVGNALAQIIEEKRVRAAEDEALAQILTILDASLGDTNARLIEEQTVRATEDAALAQSVTGVTARVDDVSADGYFAVTAQTSGGTLSKIELAARATLGSQAALAAFLMEVINEGGTLKSRNIFIADKTIFAKPDGSGGMPIAVFDGNTLKLVNVKVDSLSALSANLGNVDISNANIGTLTVGTSNIDEGAVSGVWFAQKNGFTGASDTLDLVVNHGAKSPRIVVFVSFVLRGQPGTSAESVSLEVEDITNPTTLVNTSVSLPPGGSGVTLSQPQSLVLSRVPPASATSTTFRCTLSGAAGMPNKAANTWVMYAQQLKR